MHPYSRLLILALTLLATTATGATAQGIEPVLDEVRLLTPSAARELLEAAEAGDTLAQFKIGLAYYYGYAVETMPEVAARWFRRAAELDCVAAQYMLGVQLRDGNGVDTDTAEAVHWLKAAADRGYPDAQYEYGLMLFDGIGVAQDYAEAYEVFTNAAAQGSIAARTYRGIMLVNGLGVDQNFTEGREALLQAATAGSPMAQANLGALYAGGVGVERSATEALIWFYLAEAGGFDGVGPRIADITRSLSDSEVTEAQREAERRAEYYSAGAAGETPIGDTTPRMDPAEVTAALRALGEWLVPRLAEVGTFVFGVRSDIARAVIEDELLATVRGSITVSDVSFAGCSLHWTQTIVLGEPSRWEWTVHVGKIDPSRLRVRPWEPPEGWRIVSGQIQTVHFWAQDDLPDGYFLVTEPDLRTSRVWEINIPIRDRRDAEEMMEKLREGNRLCAGY
jgi:TPR repeat protein